MAPYRASHRQSDIGIDIDLTYPVLDAFLDFLYRNTIGFFHLSAIFTDDVEPILGHGTGTMHDQMGIGNACMNFLYALDGENIPRWFARKLVCPVGGADSDRQCVYARLLDEVGCLFRVCQQLIMRKLAFGTMRSEERR